MYEFALEHVRSRTPIDNGQKIVYYTRIEITNIHMGRTEFRCGIQKYAIEYKTIHSVYIKLYRWGNTKHLLRTRKRNLKKIIIFFTNNLLYLYRILCEK